jgi:4-amino-4-deoxy-L-arabinose transferase-like glycosyltransferase
LLGALLVRTIFLTSHPFILSGSEASIGLEAQAAINGQLRSPFTTGWLTNPTLPFYLLGIPLQILGRSLLSIRILSPLLGMLSVGLILLVGRWMFGTAIGLVAAILLAGSHIHVHYSRIGLTNIWDPFFVLLSLGLFYLAWLRGDRRIWIMAGIAIGLSAYFYTSSHILPLILLGIVIVILLKWSDFIPDIRHLLAAVLIAFIVALPQILHYNAYPNEFWDRFMSQGIFHVNWLLNEVTVNGADAGTILRDQFARGLLAFHSGIDNSNLYFSGRSILGFWVSTFLLIGLGLALVRAKQVRFALLLIWCFVVLVFASAILIDPPSSHRLLIASPAVYLLVAVSLSWGTQYLFKFAKIHQKFLLPTLVLVAILLSLLDLGFYFGPYRAENRFGDRNTEIAFEMSEYLNSLEGEWTVYFYGAPSMFSSFPTFAYLIEEWQTGVNMVDIPEDAPLPRVTGDGNYLHIFVPERASELSEVQQNIPGGTVSFFDGHFAAPLFFSYSIQQ